MPKPASGETEMEVVVQPENDRRQRRRFSREEKIRILAEADRCTARGALTALLRREGLYSSHLTMWRQQLKAHGESGLEPRRAGRPAKSDKRDREIARLERRAAQLEKKLRIAHKLLDLAGKAHEILGVALPSLEDDEKR